MPLFSSSDKITSAQDLIDIESRANLLGITLSYYVDNNGNYVISYQGLNSQNALPHSRFYRIHQWRLQLGRCCKRRDGWERADVDVV